MHNSKIIYRKFCLHRVAGLMLRHYYIFKHSGLRIVELVYWPLMQVFMWGYLQIFIENTGSLLITTSGVFLGAVMLWDTLFRGQLGFSISFLEEMWSRNIGHLLLSPLRPIEMLLAFMMFSLLKVFVGLFPVIIVAYFLFDFNLFQMGFAIILFFTSIFLTSWSIGLPIIGMILRYGLGAEGLAWTIPFALLPLACVYYPVDVLPDVLYYIAHMLPPTYVFEALRSLLIDNILDFNLLFYSMLLNALYFVVGLRIFYLFLRSAKKNGKLLQTGE